MKYTTHGTNMLWRLARTIYNITPTLLTNIEHCNAVLIGKNRCLNEAYIIYDRALWDAGNSFILVKVCYTIDK